MEVNDIKEGWDLISLLHNNCIVNFTDCLSSDIQLVPMCTNINMEELAYIFFDMVL